MRYFKKKGHAKPRLLQGGSDDEPYAKKEKGNKDVVKKEGAVCGFAFDRLML